MLIKTFERLPLECADYHEPWYENVREITYGIDYHVFLEYVLEQMNKTQKLRYRMALLKRGASVDVETFHVDYLMPWARDYFRILTYDKAHHLRVFDFAHVIAANVTVDKQTWHKLKLKYPQKDYHL